MKHLSKAIIALFLALLMGTLFPARVFADTPDYISDIKIYMGSYASAEKEGYTILKDGNAAVDLNKNAGATSYGAKGNKAVYLGYKTTKDRDGAITDLAVMNMRGGYDLKEYEFLMENQLKNQIIPFVDDFLTAIKEFRENYNSSNKTNKQRADYTYRMLNKLTDDDCAGKGLGDLLLNKTKYEMGDEAYNKLSDEEKKNHADIVTIIAQANGQATFLIESLITRACDTSTEDTWLDRFSEITYYDLLDLIDEAPSTARKTLAKMYDDDANSLLERLDEFREDLEGYDEALKYLDENDVDGAMKTLEDFAELDVDKTEPEELAKAREEHAKAVEIVLGFYNASEIIAVHDYLEDIEYDEGTMLDFFLQPRETFEDDITMVYPLVASLSKGQRAGFEFISLKELVASSLTDSANLNDIKLKTLNESSIYDGVNREIYEKGGVALTSDALRKDALTKIGMNEKEKGLSGLSIALITLSSVTAAAFLISFVPAKVLSSTAKNFASKIEFATTNSKSVIQYETQIQGKMELVSVSNETLPVCDQKLARYLGDANFEYSPQEYLASSQRAANLSASRAFTAKCVTVGIGVVMVILMAFSIYCSLQDMKAYYKVDYTPIPRYMVDEKDLIGYNSKGEKIVLKNQEAYYRAVECNRATNAEYYKSVGTFADLNGDVGKQWLALYAERNEEKSPILASSLKVVTNSSEIPAGYSTGIHAFGTEVAENLNNTLYVWNSSAPTTYVYFKTEDVKPSPSGTSFTAGALAFTGGLGVLLGAVITALCTKVSGKRRDNKAVPA